MTVKIIQNSFPVAADKSSLTRIVFLNRRSQGQGGFEPHLEQVHTQGLESHPPQVSAAELSPSCGFYGAMSQKVLELLDTREEELCPLTCHGTSTLTLSFTILRCYENILLNTLLTKICTCFLPYCINIYVYMTIISKYH